MLVSFAKLKNLFHNRISFDVFLEKLTLKINRSKGTFSYFSVLFLEFFTKIKTENAKHRK